jgi:hypothetical protein
MRRFALFGLCLATAALPVVMFSNERAGAISGVGVVAISPAEASQLFGGSCCGDKFNARTCQGSYVGCEVATGNHNAGNCGSYNQSSDDEPCGNYECSYDVSGNHLYGAPTSCSK